MVKARDNYPPDAVAAAKAVLVEITHVLGEYRDRMVIVGGWVPALLLSAGDAHVGSTDVDVALNHIAEIDEVYTRISATLQAHGYVQHETAPFIWHKDVDLGTGTVVVEVDFLAGEYGGTAKSHRHQRLQEMMPRKARGADILLLGEVEERVVESRLPNGAIDRVTVRVAGIVPFIVMKCSALRGRINDKDAYDIYFCLRNYPGGVTAVAQRFVPFATHGLVLEAMATLEDKFASPEHFGPKSVADFEEALGEEAERLQRDVFEQVAALVAAVQSAGSSEPWRP